MDKLQKWFSLFEKAQNTSFSKLTEEERKFILTHFSDIDTDAIKSYRAKSKDKGYAPTPQETALVQQEMRKMIVNDKEAFLDQAEKLEKSNKKAAIVDGINTILAGGDLVQAQSQINRFKSESARSRRPSRPPVLTEDPYLEAAKQRALQETYAEPVAIQAAKAGIDEAYQGDLANARIASGGQAGAYGAYGQAAASRRGRRSLELAPMANQIKQEYNARVDRLAGESAGQRARINDSAARYYPTDISQYQFEQEQLGALGRTGFENRRTATGELAAQIPSLADQFLTERYNRYRTQIPDRYAAKLTDIDAKLTNLEKARQSNDWGITMPRKVNRAGMEPITYTQGNSAEDIDTLLRESIISIMGPNASDEYKKLSPNEWLNIQNTIQSRHPQIPEKFYRKRMLAMGYQLPQ